MHVTKFKDASRVAARAHEIWEAEGRPEGRDHDHWLRAEAELSAEIATKPKAAKKAPARKAAAKAKPAASAKASASKTRAGKKAG